MTNRVVTGFLQLHKIRLPQRTKMLQRPRCTQLSTFHKTHQPRELKHIMSVTMSESPLLLVIKFEFSTINCRWIHWIWWRKICRQKGFKPRISSVNGQCANHYTIESSVIVIIFKLDRIVFVQFADSANSLTVLVKEKKIDCFRLILSRDPKKMYDKINPLFFFT